jgi:hypothetical protein
MFDGPALCQLVIDPNCGIWNTTTRTATLLDDILTTVPRTEKMSAQRHDLSDSTLTTLVLISDYSCVGPVHRWVHPMNESPEILPTMSILITKNDSKTNRRHVGIGGHTITCKQSVLSEIQVARISREKRL